MVALVFIVFFVISFITNILGSINPNVSDSFHLSGAMTGLLPFSFFIAYGLMSIPSGMLVEKYKEKISMSGGWIVATLGAFVFALFPSYPVFLASLFFIGAAMALMQVVINPLLRVSGGEEHFAFYSVFAQLVFGGASFLSPYVYSYLVLNLDKSGPQSNWFLQILADITPGDLPWVSLYWVFGVITLLMIVPMSFAGRTVIGPKRNTIRNIEIRGGKILSDCLPAFIQEGIEVNTALKIGDPAQELMKFLADRPPFQAVVWGSGWDLPDRVRGGQRHWLSGVVGSLECPLLTVSKREAQ